MKQYEDERLYARFNQIFVQLDAVDTAELIGVMTCRTGSPVRRCYCLCSFLASARKERKEADFCSARCS